MNANASRIATRAYATAARVRAPPPPDPNRVFTPRKTQLHSEYAELIASNDVVLLLRYSNFPQAGLTKIRREVSSVGSSKSKLASPAPTSSIPPAKFTVIRPGIFAASLRTKYDDKTVSSVKSLLGGAFAVLTTPSLNPPQLAQCVKLIDRAVPKSNTASAPPPPRKPVAADDIEDPVPPVKDPPNIQLVGALIEGKMFLVEGIHEIGKLPTLETLRAQIVGLLSAPGQKIAGLLSSAAGGQLLRTLQGYEKSLQEKDEGAQ